MYWIYFFCFAFADKLLLIKPLLAAWNIFWWPTNRLIFIKDFIWFFTSQQSWVDAVNTNEKLLTVVRMRKSWIKIDLTILCLRFFFRAVEAVDIGKLFYLTIFSIGNVWPNTFTCWLIEMKSIDAISFWVCTFCHWDLRRFQFWTLILKMKNKIKNLPSSHVINPSQIVLSRWLKTPFFLGQNSLVLCAGCNSVLFPQFTLNGWSHLKNLVIFLSNTKPSGQSVGVAVPLTQS